MIAEARRVYEVKAVETEGFVNTFVFTVEGKEGLWRQIKREGRQGIRTAVEGAAVAVLDEYKLIELVRWCTLENLLSKRAALDVIPVDAEGEPVTL